MKKTWGKKIKFYFLSVLTRFISKIYVVDNINGMKFLGERNKTKKCTHFEKKVQVHNMSQVGYLMKHQAYGDNFCHWLFYKIGNCREASVTTVFKQRDCVYLLMYPVLEQHS